MTRAQWLRQAGLPTHRPPTSPGDMVLDFLAGFAVSQAKAAHALRISPNRLNEIVKNKRRITTDTALRFAAYFKTSPQLWLNVQDAWELWHDLQRSDRATTYQAIERHSPPAAADAMHNWPDGDAPLGTPMIATQSDHR